MLYKARALISLGRANDAASLVPSEPDSHSLKAVKALADYVVATDGKEEEEDEENEEADAAVEELRDICVEIEGDEDGEIKGEERWHVRVLAATAFARAGEVEEALETLAVKANRDSLEAYVLSTSALKSLKLTSNIQRTPYCPTLPLHRPARSRTASRPTCILLVRRRRRAPIYRSHALPLHRNRRVQRRVRLLH